MNACGNSWILLLNIESLVFVSFFFQISNGRVRHTTPFIPVIRLTVARAALASCANASPSHDFDSTVFVVQRYVHEHAYRNSNHLSHLIYCRLIAIITTNAQYLINSLDRTLHQCACISLCFFFANRTYHAFSMTPFCLCCCFKAFNVVKRSFNFFVSHNVSNSSIHFSSMSVLNLSAHFCGLNLVFACFKTSFMLVTSLSLQKQVKFVFIFMFARNVNIVNFA